MYAVYRSTEYPIPVIMSADYLNYDDVSDIDVNSLPLKPPQALIPPEKAIRRTWHPVMWDDGSQPGDQPIGEAHPPSKEFPHKKQIRNIRRLIAEGKVKPTSETLIFFLCNKFAISEERQARMRDS
ncbi:uncharacterized protein LOC125053148 [Pieris napi]|uniref:uncharacterized protein LOC125053148 n=1 Tax=Pieris napi TaxID=78633 RepID=UPI001FBAA33D|nr:uncharacterized protein LOC125053148 [Pieris napi]